MRELVFEFYVLRYDFNKGCIIRSNIFDSIYVYNQTLRLVVNYLCSYITYDKFTNDLLKAIKYEMWSRREHEISVGDAFEEDTSKFVKLDAFFQVEKNIDVIASSVVSIAKEFFFNEDSLNKYTRPLGSRSCMWVDMNTDCVYYRYTDVENSITDEMISDSGLDNKNQYLNQFIKRVVEDPVFTNIGY